MIGVDAEGERVREGRDDEEEVVIVEEAVDGDD
jgi:hypothetical protein